MVPEGGEMMALMFAWELGFERFVGGLGFERFRSK